jgi:uncharacterized membrane protein
MTTITQKKKLSKGTWALIFILIAALITVAVLAAVGIVDLGFLTAGYDMELGTSGLLVGYAIFGTSGWINAVIIIVIPFAVGIVVCFMMYRYFIGQKVTTAPVYGQSGGYNPVPTTPSNPQSGTETVIS